MIKKKEIKYTKLITYSMGGVIITSTSIEELQKYAEENDYTLKEEIKENQLSRSHWFYYKGKRYEIFTDEEKLTNHLGHLVYNYSNKFDKDFTYQAVLILKDRFILMERLLPSKQKRIKRKTVKKVR